MRKFVGHETSVLSDISSLTALLLYPVRNKYIGIMSAAIIAIAAKDDLFPVWRKHGKCIKSIAMSYL